MEENVRYGECAKHKGNNMFDCVECQMENNINKALRKKEIPVDAEQIVNGIHDILFYLEKDTEQRNQDAIALMESVIVKIKKQAIKEYKQRQSRL